MNPKKADLAWQRLVAAARNAEHKTEETAVPYGFSTRIVAAAFAMPTPFPTRMLFERFSWKALVVSALLMLLCLAGTLTFLSTSTSNPDDETAIADPVAEVVDIGG